MSLILYSAFVAGFSVVWPESWHLDYQITTETGPFPHFNKWTKLWSMSFDVWKNTFEELNSSLIANIIGMK